MKIDIILLVILLLSAVWTVMTTRLMRSVIALGITSAVLSVVMFRLNAPLAAVFELSVCAGLISVIFITTVGFTHRLTQDALLLRKRERFAKFWYLPVILIFVAVVLSQAKVFLDIKPAAVTTVQDVREVLWNTRHADLLGQIIILMAGTFGVVLLFKALKK